MDISRKTFVWAIAGLIILRVFLIVLEMNNIPFTDMQTSTWRPNFSGSYHPDEDEIFAIARALASGTVANRVPNLGYPLFITPIVYLTGASNAIDIYKIVFVVEGFILFSLAIILVVLLGYKIFNSRKLAVVGATLFTIYPWPMFLFFKAIGYRNAIAAFHYQLWIFILTDYLSALLVYLSFYLILRLFEEKEKTFNQNRGKVILLSIFSGFAFLTRIGNIWTILIIFAVLLWLKKTKDIVLYISVFSVVYLPQLIYNTLAFGAPWRYGYTYASRYAIGGGFGWHNIFQFSKLWLNFKNFSPDYYLILFIFSSIFLILISIFGYKYLWKINKNFAIITITWFWSYTLFYWSFDVSLSQLRYFLPAISPFIFLFVGAITYLMNKIYIHGQSK